MARYRFIDCDSHVFEPGELRDPKAAVLEVRRCPGPREQLAQHCVEPDGGNGYSKGEA